jgi:pyruvate-formate lyase-activating enzyme
MTTEARPLATARPAPTPGRHPSVPEVVPYVPTDAEVSARLERILARGSLNLGAASGIERLMLMLTRSCELRCGYCFVQKTETGTDMPLAIAQRGVDLIMASSRPKLEVQFFGGEPSRRWETLSAVLDYAEHHPQRNGRSLEFVITTNGAGLTPARLQKLAQHRVMILFSLDGDAKAHARFRAAHLVSDAEAYGAIDRTVDLLLTHDVPWFMNTTIPPAAAGEVEARYAWARRRGIPRLQLNYSVGHYWNPAQERRYLEGLQRVLLHHAASPDGLLLFNWRSECEPTMLSDDLIVDVDGTVCHDGAIFLERSLPRLKETYARGHLYELHEFDPLRWNLRKLHDVMTTTYADGSRERRAIVQNIRMGAAVDLVIERIIAALGPRCPIEVVPEDGLRDHHEAGPGRPRNVGA